jgi:hypothetical protein
MRLFPHTWEGLHPAFPKQSNDSESCLSAEQPFPINLRFVPHGDGYSGMAVACIIARAVPFFSPPTLRFAAFIAKTTVFATGLGVARGINIELSDRQMAPIFLRSRHIDLPSVPLVDRLSHWDHDNWSILGGVAGLFAARRTCQLPGLTRPMWSALHVIAGVGLAGMGYWTQTFATLGSQALAYCTIGKKHKIALQKMTYQPEIIREHVLHMLGYLDNPLTGVELGLSKMSPEIAVALKKRRTLDNPYSYLRSNPQERGKTVVELTVDPPNDSDAFHKTYTPPGEAEPVPYAVRNYAWSGSLEQGNSAFALEQHIADLRKQRQKACDQAEALRAWLYDREVDFYKLKEAPNSDKDELKSQQKYLEVLARWHLSTWRAVGECDWMIADATDHLTFMETVQKGLTWQPARLFSDRSQSVDLRKMLEGLDMHLKTTYVLLQQIEIGLVEGYGTHG